MKKQFRFNNTFKKPSDKSRISMLFKNATTNKSHNRTFNFNKLRAKKSSSFTIKKLGFRLRSSFDSGYKHSRSMEDTTRGSSFYGVDRENDMDYEDEINGSYEWY